MNITKKQRIELDAMSKKLTGSSNKWHKLIDKGYDELVTEEVEETVPAEKEGDEPTVRKVQTPVLSASGGRQYVRKYHTVESVIEFMKTEQAKVDEFVKQRQEMIAKFIAEQDAKKKQAEAEAAAKKVHDEASGGALA